MMDFLMDFLSFRMSAVAFLEHVDFFLRSPLGIIILRVFFVIPFWRIFKRAGFNGALSLMAIIPFLGDLNIAALLSFANWPNKPNVSSLVKE